MITQAEISNPYLAHELKTLRSVRSFYKTYPSEEQSKSIKLPMDIFARISINVSTYTPFLFFLKQRNFDLNQQDKDGKTLAFIAAEEGCVEIFRLLNELGADLNLPDKDGRTPAFIAAEKGLDATYKELKNLGAKDILAPPLANSALSQLGFYAKSGSSSNAEEKPCLDESKQEQSISPDC